MLAACRLAQAGAAAAADRASGMPHTPIPGHGAGDRRPQHASLVESVTPAQRACVETNRLRAAGTGEPGGPPTVHAVHSGGGGCIADSGPIKWNVCVAGAARTGRRAVMVTAACAHTSKRDGVPPRLGSRRNEGTLNDRARAPGVRSGLQLSTELVCVSSAAAHATYNHGEQPAWSTNTQAHSACTMGAADAPSTHGHQRDPSQRAQAARGGDGAFNELNQRALPTPLHFKCAAGAAAAAAAVWGAGPQPEAGGGPARKARIGARGGASVARTGEGGRAPDRRRRARGARAPRARGVAPQRPRGRAQRRPRVALGCSAPPVVAFGVVHSIMIWSSTNLEMVTALLSVVMPCSCPSVCTMRT